MKKKNKHQKQRRRDLYTSSFSTELVCGRVQVLSSVYPIILQSRTVPAGGRDRDLCEELASLVHKHAAQMLMTDTWICASDYVQMRREKRFHFLGEFFYLLVKWGMGGHIFLMRFLWSQKIRMLWGNVSVQSTPVLGDTVSDKSFAKVMVAITSSLIKILMIIYTNIGRNWGRQVELRGGNSVLHSLSFIPQISKLRDLLEYLVLPSWPETCVFSTRTQILERDMQEADQGAVLMLPGCQLRLGKHSQIS